MVENLDTEQSAQVLHFLLHRMGLETRRALMAALPVAYATLYPTVPADTLTAMVSAKIHAMRGSTRCAPTGGGDG